MHRLQFDLPNFTRIAWTSSEARELWEPRINAARKMWEQLEYLTVSNEIRRCAKLSLSPHELVRISRIALEQGFELIPLRVEPQLASYAASAQKPQPGDPTKHVAVFGRKRDVKEFIYEWERSDDLQIGALLGYPACCRKFFDRVWNKEAIIDPTWQMCNTVKGDDCQVCEVAGPPHLNLLLRWLGVRAVPHLPCGFHCKESLEMSQTILTLARDLDFNNEVDWLLDMLSWPMEWSALHGIADIKSPIMRLSANSVTTASRYVVRRQSDSYPERGAYGIAFPYRQKPKRKRASQNSFGNRP